ncbi:hypothetical protein NESM_000634000 [Novymonas esmeraldas]|uniref:Uncharacterized protein n=1 Tax=Novymonas esmeraldas TaxID=1808958 RepID=A0AAW0EVF6_9TRYP
MSSEDTSPASPGVMDDGAEDVVEAVLTSTFDAHPTHLVEGDFFPAEAPAVAEVDGTAADDGDGLGEAGLDETAAAVATAAVPTSTPPKAAAVPSRKRVCWADEAQRDTAHALVKHVTSFYMPNTPSRREAADTAGPARQTHAPAVNPTPPLFREKAGSDGTTYKFCKALRPAVQYAEWKRQPHDYGTSAFEPQPEDAGQPAVAARTLFGELLQRSVVARAAEGQVRVRNGAQRGGRGEGLQLPLVRVDAAFDGPLQIPLAPGGGGAAGK